MKKIAVDGGNLIPYQNVSNGIERVVDSFIREFCQKGFKNYSLNYYYFNNNPPKIIKRHNLTLRKLPMKFFASVFLPINLTANQDKIFLGFSGYISALTNLSGVKKILFLYDLGFIKYPQYYKNAQRLRERTNHAIYCADKIVVLSEHAKKELLASFPRIKNSKVIRIYSGIDHLSRFSKTAIKKGKYFLFVGMIRPSKNIEALIKYFQVFLQNSADKQFKLILVGKSEAAYQKKILKMLESLKLKKHVKFVGNVSDRKLSAYYRHACAVVNSSYEEGFCFPVLEGLAMGKTVIVNNLPIYKEYRKYFDNLQIAKDEKEFTLFMQKAAEEKKSRRKSQIAPSFTWKNFTKELLEVIDNLA